MVNRISLLFFLLFSLVFSSKSQTRVWHVPADIPVIQTALDTAKAGDTILVAPGTYFESLKWPAVDSIKLLSSGDSTNTKLVSNGIGRNIYFEFGFSYSRETKVAGFTFTRAPSESTFSSNGASILMYENAKPTIENIHFTQFSFNNNGTSMELWGLIYMSNNCSPAIRNCKFSQIKISDLEKVIGLAICMENGCNPVLSNIIIDSIQVKTQHRIYGGGVYMEDNCNPIVENVTIGNLELSTAHWLHGMGFYIQDNCNPKLRNVEIHNVHIKASSWNYGAVYITDNSSPELKNIRVHHIQTDSSSWCFGTGLYIDGQCNPIIKDVEINNVEVKSATYLFGTGIYVADESSPNIQNVFIHDLKLTSNNYLYGGAIHIEDSCNHAYFDSITIKNVVAYSNYDLNGLGMSIESSHPTIKNLVIQDGVGSAKRYSTGGGICIMSGSSPFLENFTICNNSLRGNIGIGLYYIPGAGIYISEYSKAKFTNGQITNNRLIGLPNEFKGIGVFCQHYSTPTFMNCTIADNSCEGTVSGTGVYLRYYSNPTFTNCILRNQTTGTEIGMDTNCTATITYSNIRGGYAGIGNIDTDPLFAAGGCYSLTPNSPSFGKGTSAGAPSKDLYGNSRPALGNVLPSMGAIEIYGIDMLGDYKTVCLGEPTLLNAGFGFSSYKWSTGDTTATIQVSTNGTFSVVGTKGCCEHYDTIQVIFTTPPAVDLGNDTTVCYKPVLLDAGSGMSTYLWNNGITTQTLNVTTKGTYSVKVTDSSGCTASDTVLIVDCTGIENYLGDEIILYPNPTTGKFRISASDFERIEIVNNVGQMVMNATQSELNISDQPVGIYYVKIISKNGIGIRKLIKT